MVNRIADLQLAKCHFKHRHGGFVLERRFLDEHFLRAFHHVEHGIGERTETAAFEQDGLFIKQLTGDDVFAVGGKERGLGEPLLNKLEGHQTIIHAGEGGAGKFDHVNLGALAGQPVEQRTNQTYRVMVLVKRAVDEADAENADGFLLAGRFPIEQSRMNDDCGRIAVRVNLKFDAEPALAFFHAGPETLLGRDSVRKGEKGAFVAACFVEALEQQVVFVVEHGLQAHAADITV
jgi:hypothetical protein